MRPVAQILISLAVRAAPAHRAEWARSMAVELDHVDRRSALAFAAGCLWSAWVWRLATRQGLAAAGRCAIAAGTTGLAAFAWLVAGRFDPEGAASLVLLGVGLFYAGAAVVAVAGGLTRVAWYGVAGLGLNATAVILGEAIAPGAADRPYLQALALEEFGFLLVLIAFAVTVEQVSRRLRPLA